MAKDVLDDFDDKTTTDSVWTTETRDDDGNRLLHDAVVIGTAHPDMDAILNRDTTFLRGELWGERDKRNTPDGKWKATTMPLWQWIEGFDGDGNTRAFGFSRHPEGKYKEGQSIVLGDSIGGARKAKAMTTMDAMGLDIDSGTELDRMVEKIEELGLFALIYTTHSHGKAGMELKRDEVLRKLGTEGPLTEADVRTFLRDHHKDRFEDHWIEGVTIKEEKHQTKEGMRVILDTPPLDKYRVIFPLWEPIKIIDLADREDAALTVWEDKITGLAVNTLNTHFDRSCTDPSRLFYTARHPKGGEWDCVVIEGRPLRFEDVTPHSKALYSRGRTDPANAFTMAGGDMYGTRPPECSTPSGDSLNEWHRMAKGRFLIADMLEQLAPDRIRVAGGETAGTVHIDCPFQHEHSDEGGTATMAMNCDTTEHDVWTVFCRRDACQGRHKLEFVEQMLRDQWFPEAALTDEDWLLPPSDDEIDDDPIATQRDGKARLAETGTTAESIAADADSRWSMSTTTPEVKEHFQMLIAAESDIAVLNMTKDEIAKATPFGKADLNRIIGEIRTSLKKAAKASARKKLKGISIAEDEPFNAQTAAVVQAFQERMDNPTVFHCGGGLVRIEHEQGIARSKEVNKDKLRNEIGRIAPFDREGKNIAVPPDVRDWLYAEPFADNFAPLVSVQTTPFFASDGTLIDKPGYHKDAQVWLELPDNMKNLEVPDEPTQGEVDNALLLLTEEVFGDFPIGGADREGLMQAYRGDVENPSYANLIGLAVLPFMRQMVDGPTPGHVLEKPQPRTGASLLADVISTIATGFPVPAMSMPGNRDEMSKTLTTVLRGGQNIVCFDNINSGVDSGELASAMTARTYQARILGATALVTVLVNCIWIMTANNLEMSEEMAERCNLIELNANTTKPGQRDGFRHKDILTYVGENRPAIVRACLVLIRHWIVTGKTDGIGKLGGFEKWVRVVGGVVAAAGVDGFMGNRERFVGRVSGGETEGGVQALMNRLSAHPDGTIIRAGTDKVPQGIELNEGQTVLRLLDVLNAKDDADDRIYLDKWGMVDGDYVNPASAGTEFRKLERMPFDCTDSTGAEWRVTIKEHRDTAKKPYFVLSKTVAKTTKPAETG